jgi:hypothetical protein
MIWYGNAYVLLCMALWSFFVFPRGGYEVTKLDNVSDRVVIFVHGTLPTFFGPAIRWADIPQGLNSTCTLKDRLVLSRIPHVLARAYAYHGEDISYDSFYMYGWNGNLCFHCREEAGKLLYEIIKDYTGEIILIGHSHGGNVALEAIKAAMDDNNHNLNITLVLLAVPIQKITEEYANAPIVKKAFSFYSISDRVQVLDPQGAYQRCRKIYKGEKIPFFSERFLPCYDNLIQSRIIFHDRNLSHLGFMMPYFLRTLPEVLEVLERDASFGERVVTRILRNGCAEVIEEVWNGCLRKKRWLPRY